MRTLRARLSIVGELMSFLWKAKLWWMIPLVLILLLFGGLILLAQTSAIAPFIYTLF
jgi:hypothetical protein